MWRMLSALALSVALVTSVLSPASAKAEPGPVGGDTLMTVTGTVVSVSTGWGNPYVVLDLGDSRPRVHCVFQEASSCSSAAATLLPWQMVTVTGAGSEPAGGMIRIEDCRLESRLSDSLRSHPRELAARVADLVVFAPSLRALRCGDRDPAVSPDILDKVLRPSGVGDVRDDIVDLWADRFKTGALKEMVGFLESPDGREAQAQMVQGFLSYSADPEEGDMERTAETALPLMAGLGAVVGEDAQGDLYLTYMESGRRLADWSARVGQIADSLQSLRDHIHWKLEVLPAPETALSDAWKMLIHDENPGLPVAGDIPVLDWPAPAEGRGQVYCLGLINPAGVVHEAALFQNSLSEEYAHLALESSRQVSFLSGTETGDPSWRAAILCFEYAPSTRFNLEPDIVIPPPPDPDLSGFDESPQVVNAVAPDYPDEVRRLGLEGRVDVEATIDLRGRVTETKIVVLSSKSPGMDIEILGQLAEDAALRWRFTPALFEGAAVRAKIIIPFEFSLH